MVTEEHASMLERRVVQLQREVTEYRERERILQVIIGALIVLVVIVALAGAAGADEERNEARRIDFGPRLNSLAWCESTGMADVVNSSSGAAGLWQWLPSSWDSVARIYGKDHLIGVDPRDATLAQQYRQTRRYVALDGYWPWVCSPYGNTSPVLVSGDRPTKAPKKCRKNLEQRWDVAPKQARRICR